MKKAALFSLATLLLSFSSWVQADETPMVEIECSIVPIDRSTVHPGGVATSQSSQSLSSNWSGYVAATDFKGRSADGTVTYVAGSWVVPTLVPTTNGTYCSSWVGMDGYISPTVEQIGTAHMWIGGAQINYAWFDMYPHGVYLIDGFPVDNGDMMSARIGYKGNGNFKLVLFNHTKGVSTVIPSSYTMSPHALRKSAEWIVESFISGSILPLADFKTITFNYCSATIDGVSGIISDDAWKNEEVTMVGLIRVRAQPTELLKDGSCFQVNWKSQ